MTTLKGWYDAIEDILMCTVCLDIPTSQVLQCKSGHPFCAFCKNKLVICPMCQMDFIKTRNILAENLIECFNNMKVFLDNEFKRNETRLLNKFEEEMKTKFPDKEVKTVSSQTNYSACQTPVCSSTQTDKVTFTSCITKMKQKSAQKSAISYPCLIGSCLMELPYTDLIKHLTMCHKGTFYQVEQRSGIFIDKCTIESDILPKSIDFAFLINNMGLFFFNVTLDDNGLIASVKLADNMVTMAFEYHIHIANKVRLFKAHNMVTSCRLNERSATGSNLCKFGKEIHSTAMDKSIECTLTIKKYKRRSP